ncbi:MAG: tRNA dihydrouridine synthase DusB [Candidatus Sericytochromatia bacterium]|nr:tRNA dihydrouridine synthase DusB [Candidatus Sericytochromatia bacterium]
MLLRPLKIRDLTFPANVLLAPMAGVTDRAFREMVRRWSPDELTCTEMAVAQHLVHSRELPELSKIYPADPPIAMQIAGHDPYYMAKAAEMAVDFGAVIVDINMACPSKKINGNGDGVSVTCVPSQVDRVLKAVVGATPLPVTLKLRLGMDDLRITCTETARIAEQCGISMITLHGRTKAQMYSGLANWDMIDATAKAIGIPLIGVGDIRSPEDAERRLRETSVAGVMVGRAMGGTPWLIGQITEYLRTGVAPPDPTEYERLGIAMEHLTLIVQYKGEKVGVPEARKHMAWYTKGMVNSAEVRDIINRLPNLNEVIEALSDFRENFRPVAA